MLKEAYPDVCIQTVTTAAGNEAEVVPGSHFLPVEENVWKKGLNAFRDHGLYAALEQFASSGIRSAFACVYTQTHRSGDNEFASCAQ